MVSRPRTPRPDFPARFWAKVDTSRGPDGCWPWTGCKSLKRAGTWRGIVRYGARMLLAHRVALWLQADPDATDLAGYDRPDAPHLQAGHTCHNRRCCNPRHLDWQDRTTNEADRAKARLLTPATLHDMAMGVLQSAELHSPRHGDDPLLAAPSAAHPSPHDAPEPAYDDVVPF